MCSTSLAIWDIPIKWKWACYILSGFGGGLSGLCFAWAHEICTHDNEERAIVVAAMNEMAYVVQAWLPLLVWKQVEAPQYRKGFITVTFLSAGMIATALAIRLLHARDLAKRRNAPATDEDELNRSDEETTGSASDVDLGQVKAP
jgi:hypothetical protein